MRHPVGVGFYMEDPPGGLELNLGSFIRCWGIYVKPEARGKGLSYRIQEKGLEEASIRGYDNYLGAFSKTNQRTQELLDGGARIVESAIVVPLRR